MMVIDMGRRCKVCWSPHVAEYEELYLTGKMNMKEILQYAREKYGETFSYPSLSRHFRNHVDPYVEMGRKVDRIRNKFIEEQIKKDIEIAKRLTRNLEICAEMIEKYITELQNEGLSKDREDSLRKWLTETRMTIDTALRYSKELQLDKKKPMDENKLLDIVEKCLDEIPDEYASAFKKKWDELVNELQ